MTKVEKRPALACETQYLPYALQALRVMQLAFNQ